MEVRDAVNGMPAARGVTGVSKHESGVLTDLYAIDDLRLRGDWSRELPGHHTIPRFTLPEPTRLLLTNGFSVPVELFEGLVQPSAAGRNLILSAIFGPRWRTNWCRRWNPSSSQHVARPVEVSSTAIR